ncbi:MAG: sucrose synthase [Planctomycetales bacterium]|nr:sucrose synthase [Planctomycetales bacterium]
MGLRAGEQPLLLSDQIAKRLHEFLNQHDIEPRAARFLDRMFRGCSEMVFDADSAYAVLRPGVGLKRIIRVHPQLEQAEEVSRAQYLEIKDAQIQGHEQAAKKGLVIDFAPFFRDFPKVNEAAEMGEGISFLNRHLSAQMYQSPQVFRNALLDFLRCRHLNGESILVNDHLTTPSVLLEELSEARDLLNDYADETPWEEVAHELRTHGFDPGWGRTVKIIRENLKLLAQVLESSEPARFERLLSRLPLIRTVVMVSPHGWFGQDGVLGRPDTGGQVTYVLDQALALEQEMRRQFVESGLDVRPKVIILTRLIPDADGTACNVAREKIRGTEDGWIVRAPFRDERGEIVPQWISRFQIWPYLEQFAEDAKQVVVTELMGKPDLIVGHYTDGNLVASRLADDLDTTHCACVHALEKTKYLLSDMHWADMEKEYRFSMQFTADLIGYNSADFIISSSYREVGGTPTEMGMIESYELFSMPGLYRVRSGFNPRLARHNIVPPGASEEYFFSMHESSRRVDEVANQLNHRFLSAEPGDDCMGRLDDPSLPPIFAMARLDKIKNLSGLVELFGKSPTLRSKANLLIVSSIIDASQSNDHEEIDEINRVKQLLEEYELEGHVRWCAARLDKLQTGEIYRLVAERYGVFAQPALMETFGLTVIEAMACSLPVVVTCFGGPSEIVIHEMSGLIADPNDHERFAAALERTVSNRAVWDQFSRAGEQRVQEAFTWRRHAERVLRMANIYDYWNYLDVMNRQSLDQYIHTLYHAVYRPRTQNMLHEAEEG